MDIKLRTPVAFCSEGDNYFCIDGVVVGVLTRVEDSGSVFVNCFANSSGNFLLSRSVVRVSKNDIGREVVLMFERGNPQRPIVMGFLQEQPTPETDLFNHALSQDKTPIDIRVDGHRITLLAKKEIILKCGAGSIAIRKDGKIVIKGTHLVSRASGPNRIKGGSVQIN